MNQSLSMSDVGKCEQIRRGPYLKMMEVKITRKYSNFLGGKVGRRLSPLNTIYIDNLLPLNIKRYHSESVNLAFLTLQYSYNH